MVRERHRDRSPFGASLWPARGRLSRDYCKRSALLAALGGPLGGGVGGVTLGWLASFRGLTTYWFRKPALLVSFTHTRSWIRALVVTPCAAAPASLCCASGFRSRGSPCGELLAGGGSLNHRFPGVATDRCDGWLSGVEVAVAGVAYGGLLLLVKGFLPSDHADPGFRGEKVITFRFESPPREKKHSK